MEITITFSTTEGDAHAAALLQALAAVAGGASPVTGATGEAPKGDADPAPDPEPAPKKRGRKPKAKAKAKAKPKAEPADDPLAETITENQLRNLLRKKMDEVGHQGVADMLEEITGCRFFKDVAVEDYAAIKEAAEALKADDGDDDSGDDDSPI